MYNATKSIISILILVYRKIWLRSWQNPRFCAKITWSFSEKFCFCHIFRTFGHLCLGKERLNCAISSPCRRFSIKDWEMYINRRADFVLYGKRVLIRPHLIRIGIRSGQNLITSSLKSPYSCFQHRCYWTTKSIDDQKTY